MEWESCLHLPDAQKNPGLPECSAVYASLRQPAKDESARTNGLHRPRLHSTTRQDDRLPARFFRAFASTRPILVVSLPLRLNPPSRSSLHPAARDFEVSAKADFGPEESAGTGKSQRSEPKRGRPS